MARPSIPRPILLEGLQHSWHSYSQTLDHLLLAAEGDTWLSKLTVPVHLMVGDRDRVPDLAHLRELSGHHRRLRVTVISGAGHDLPLTHAGVLMAALVEATPET